MKASLVENCMKSYTKEMLTRCKLNKKNYYNIIFNISFGIIMFSVLGLFLWNGRNTKLYKEKNKEKNEREKQEYIIKTCKAMKEHDNQRRCQMISSLPFESHLHKKDKIFI